MDEKEEPTQIQASPARNNFEGDLWRSVAINASDDEANVRLPSAIEIGGSLILCPNLQPFAVNSPCSGRKRREHYGKTDVVGARHSDRLRPYACAFEFSVNVFQMKCRRLRDCQLSRSTEHYEKG